MRKVLCLVALVVLAAGAAGAFEFGPYIGEGSLPPCSLGIDHVYSPGDSAWLWTYTLTVPDVLDASNGTPIDRFSVGLAFNDVPSGLASGTYYDYRFNGVLWTDLNELEGSAEWFNLNLDDTTATFSFLTTLPDVTLGNHAARDHGYTDIWIGKETPGPIIPEASTVMLGLMGLCTVAGFRKFYKR